MKKDEIIKSLNTIIMEAIESRASDIHLNPDQNGGEVKYRIDGKLKKISRFDSVFDFKKHVSRIKEMFHGDMEINLLPQDGKIIIKVNDKQYDLRVSVFPTVDGEKATLRILDKLNITFDYDRIFCLKEDLAEIKNIVSKPNGLVFVSGPTGSGKTTTLYSMVNDFAKRESCMVLSVEDPVEYNLEGVMQSQVDEKIGKTFPAMLRSTLRCDPDVIMAGEIRDEKTLELLIKIAVTGHYVLSALHTADIKGSLSRLMEISSHAYMLSASLLALVNQRLLRKPCKHCSKKYKPSDAEAKSFGVKNKKSLKFVDSVGCEKCHFTGYMGRVAIYEIMTLDKGIKDLIVEGDKKMIDSYIDENVITFSKKIGEYLEKGLTTVSEAGRVLGDVL